MNGVQNVQDCQRECSGSLLCDVFSYYLKSKTCLLIQGLDNQLVDQENAFSGKKNCFYELEKSFQACKKRFIGESHFVKMDQS